MTGRRVTAALARFWTSATAIFLLVIAVHVMTQPSFPLGLGLIRTNGLAGLLVTLVPAGVGLAGAVLVRGSSRLGPGLVLAYAAFWSVVLGSGLPSIWNAKTSFCLSGLGFCITSPWIGRIAAIGILAAFLLVGGWAYRVWSERARTTGR